MKKYRLKTREELEADPDVYKTESGAYWHRIYHDAVVDDMFEEPPIIHAEFTSPNESVRSSNWRYLGWMCVEIEEATTVKDVEKAMKAQINHPLQIHETTDRWIMEVVYSDSFANKISFWDTVMVVFDTRRVTYAISKTDFDYYIKK